MFVDYEISIGFPIPPELWSCPGSVIMIFKKFRNRQHYDRQIFEENYDSANIMTSSLKIEGFRRMFETEMFEEN